jgi:hypothetical protein
MGFRSGEYWADSEAWRRTRGKAGRVVHDLLPQATLPPTLLARADEVIE